MVQSYNAPNLVSYIINIIYILHLLQVKIRHMLACSFTSVVSDSVTLCRVACQTLHSMGFFQARRLEWAALLCSKGSSDPGIKPVSLMSPALAGRFLTTSVT